MTLKWQKKTISLPYWLGEICLFRKSFKLQATNIDFQNHSPDVDLPKPTQLDSQDDGHMLYSVPLPHDHKILWRTKDYIHFVSQSFNRYLIDLNLSYEGYLNTFSSKTRSTLRRKIRKFEKQSDGEIDWRTYSSPTEMNVFHKIARTISKETYQEKLLNAGLPEDDAFCSDMTAKAAQGNVRGYLLYLNGEAISYLYTPIDQGRFVYAFLGYLPQTSKHSPGTVLLFKVLEHLFECKEGTVFDFTEGQSDQKKQFSTTSIYCGNLVCLKYSTGNHFWLWLNKLTNNFSQALGNMLEAIGLKKAIKKFLRR